MNKLSLRLKTIYDMIEPNLSVCDLCSDHGLIPIELIKNNKSNKVIATDINQSSVDKIKSNIIKEIKIEDYKLIDVRKGNGLSIINNNDFDILIISGIGCDLMIDILKNIDNYNYKYLLLSPQTKIDKFREYLISNNLFISNEKIVYDGKKYYFIIKVTKNTTNVIQNYNKSELLYSKYLLHTKNQILYNYIKQQIRLYKKIINKINTSTTNKLNKYEYLLNISNNIIKEW